MGYKVRRASQYKQGVYRGKQYDSGWELRHIQSLDAQGVRYERHHGIVILYDNPVERRQARYIPDFVVHHHGRIYLQEVKPAGKVTDPVVQAKARAASAWCRAQGAQWEYVFVTVPGQIAGTRYMPRPEAVPAGRCTTSGPRGPQEKDPPAPRAGHSYAPAGVPTTPAGTHAIKEETYGRDACSQRGGPPGPANPA